MGNPNRHNARNWVLGFAVLALLLGGIFAGAHWAGLPRIPTDGVQVEISHASSSTYRISDKGQVLATIPVRNERGREIRPIKAVVHKDVLYILYEDDSVIELRNPESSSFEDWALHYGRPVAVDERGAPRAPSGADSIKPQRDPAPVVVTASQVITRQIGYILCVVFVPGSDSVLIAGKEGQVQLIDLPTGALVRSMVGHEETVQGLAVSRDGQFAVTASLDNSVRASKVDTGEQVRHFQDDREVGGWFTSVALSTDRKVVAAGGGDGKVSLWDFQSGQLLRRLQGGQRKTAEPASPHLWRGHRGPVTSVVFSSDGRYVVTTAKDPDAKLWETETGVNIGIFKTSHVDVYAVAFEPQGNVLATGSFFGEGNTVMLWKVHDREWGDGNYNWLGKLEGNAVGYTEMVHAMRFSPDGRFLFAASDDGTARQWDARTGREVARFEGHKGPVLSLDVDASGKVLLTGGQDGTIRVWMARD